MEAAAVNRDESQEMPGSCTCNPDLYYPESLFNYAKVVSFRCPKALFQIDETGAAVRLRPNICLPSLIMDELLMHFVKDGKVDNAFLYLLGQAENISLKCAALHGCDDISDDGLKELFKHNLQSLDISDCSGVTAKTMENLLRCKDSLQHLNIDFCRGIITKEVMQNFNFTNLMSLNVNSIQLLKFETHLVEQFFSQLKNLTSLDMSNQVQVHSTKSLDFLNLVAGQLQSLVLYNCKPKLITDSWNIICSMPRLQHLDVSQEPTGMTFGQPRFLTNVITPQMLSKLAESTPTLRSLDISRHNLGSWDEELADESDPNVYVQSSIPGLKRLRRPLDFIGMWMTRWIDGVPPNEDQRRQRSKHTHVPAEKVAGGLTKDTLLVALEVYTERRRRFLKVLTIYHRHHRLLESEEVMVRVAKSIFRAMSYHSVDTDLHVQCIDMLCSIITKYSEDGLKFPKGKLHQQMIRAVLRSAARPQCGQSFVDSVCDAFSILEMWESDLEFIPFVKILFRFVTENIIYDMPDLFDLLVMTINTADADKIAQLIDNDVVQLTMTLINMVIRHGETENPNDPYTDPDDTLEPLNVGWHILKKVTAFGNSRGQFLFGGGVPMIKFCINHMLHCNELLGQSKAHRPPYTCLAEELHMPDVCWCEGFDVSVQQNTKMMTSVAGVICNLVLDAECQPFFEDLVLHLYISLTRTNMMPSNTAVAFCILALERPNLWEDESARLSMFDQVVGSRGLRKDVATDVGKLREALMNKDISALITEKAP